MLPKPYSHMKLCTCSAHTWRYDEILSAYLITEPAFVHQGIYHYDNRKYYALYAQYTFRIVMFFATDLQLAYATHEASLRAFYHFGRRSLIAWKLSQRCIVWIEFISASMLHFIIVTVWTKNCWLTSMHKPRTFFIRQIYGEWLSWFYGVWLRAFSTHWPSFSPLCFLKWQLHELKMHSDDIYEFS